ncbi:hypothetical protein Scep_024132 [Stephania cephalantha]|uniref:Uncharacterized protein n=1 Tax=Stephania cephalantha TaxID=152367 RepID=A0AAP0EYV2_9MAGN
MVKTHVPGSLALACVVLKLKVTNSRHLVTRSNSRLRVKGLFSKPAMPSNTPTTLIEIDNNVDNVNEKKKDNKTIIIARERIHTSQERLLTNDTSTSNDEAWDDQVSCSQKHNLRSPEDKDFQFVSEEEPVSEDVSLDPEMNEVEKDAEADGVDEQTEAKLGDDDIEIVGIEPVSFSRMPNKELFQTPPMQCQEVART